MTTEKPKTPPPLPGAGDSRLDRFLQKAAPIIAAQRGLNPKSRILLEALARDIRLPDDLFDQAIHMLQGAPPVAARAKNRWVEAFCVYLHQKLNDAGRGIFTAEMEARAMRKAKRKFQLSEQQARDAIHEVVAELGLRRISLSEAERHVSDLVQQKVADAEWLDDATAERLHAVGREWGLSTGQVDAIIGRCTEENRRRQQREQRTTVIALTAAGAVIGTLLIALVALLWLGGQRDEVVPLAPPLSGPPGAHAAPAAKRTASAPPAEKPVKPPAWWGDRLTVATVRARINLPWFAPVYAELASPDAGRRAEGYRRLATLCRAQGKPRQLTQFMVDHVFVQSYAREPSDEAAERLRSSLMGLAEVREDRLPNDAGLYELGFWAVRVAADALEDERLSSERAVSLELALGQAVGTAVRRGTEPAALQRLCQGALAQRYYHQLTAHARSEPYRASDLHEKLSRLAGRLLPAERLNRLDAAFLGALLAAPGDAWRRYQENGLLRICVDSRDPINILKIVEGFEQAKDRALQIYLTGLFIRSLDIVPRSAHAADVAAAVREKLGVTAISAAATARDRWRILQRKVAENATQPDVGPGRQRERLRPIIQVAYLATLACALAQQDPGFPVFDQLIQDGPPALSGEGERPDDRRGPRGSRPSFRPTQVQRSRLKHYIDSLASFEEYQPLLRLTYVRGLARLTDTIREITPEQGAVIAKYLTAAKDEEEQASVLESVEAFTRWNYVKLALADEADRTRMSRAEFQKLLSALLGHTVPLEDESRWRQVAHQKLLRSALEDLRAPSAMIAARDPDHIYDAAAAALHELYKTRAKLLGLPPAQYESTESASQVLRALVGRAVSELAAGPANAAETERLVRLPHQLRVVDYLAHNDLQETALLQRLWLQCLAVRIQRGLADRAPEAEKLLEGLSRRDATASDLLAQLLDGEQVALKMWLLYAL